VVVYTEGNREERRRRTEEEDFIILSRLYGRKRGDHAGQKPERGSRMGDMKYGGEGLFSEVE
jgi:hypothetical protein